MILSKFNHVKISGISVIVPKDEICIYDEAQYYDLLLEAKIGNNNKIAPLSCIYKGCGDNSYMLGNPVLKIG